MSASAGPFAAFPKARRSLAVVGLATMGGLAGAYAVSSLLPPTYEARSSVVVTYADGAQAASSKGPRTGDGEDSFDLSMLQAMVPTIAHMAESRNVVAAAARTAHVPPGQVLGQADADYEPGDTIITLTAPASTATGAAAMANAVADVVHDQVSDGRMVLGRRGILAAQRLDRASPPEAPVTPKPALNLALGGTLGLLAGLAFTTLGAQSNYRLRTAGQVEAELGLPVIGTLPRLRRLRGGARTELRRRRTAASVQAMVAALVPYAALPGRRLLLTSPTGSEAKTSVAALLGLGCADQELQTALIDAEFARPRLARQFPGGECESLQRILATNARPLQRHHGTLRVVATEARPPSVARHLLASAPFRTFVGWVASRCDVVVLNGPPVLAGADLSALVEHADAAILVVTSQSTRTSDARMAVQVLGRLEIPVAGVVVVDARDAGGSGRRVAAGHELTSSGTTATRPEPSPEPQGVDAAGGRAGREREQAGSSATW